MSLVCFTRWRHAREGAETVQDPKASWGVGMRWDEYSYRCYRSIVSYSINIRQPYQKSIHHSGWLDQTRWELSLHGPEPRDVGQCWSTTPETSQANLCTGCRLGGLQHTGKELARPQRSMSESSLTGRDILQSKLGQ